MKYDPEIHHRRSIRIKGYDYSLVGWYFITLCVDKRLCLFGEISMDEMNLNDAGKTIDRLWREIPAFYKGVYIDEYIVMPNHLHGIIILDNENVGASPRGRPLKDESVQTQGPVIKDGQAQGPAPTNYGKFKLGDIVGRFKSLSMHQYYLGIQNHKWKSYCNKLWQRNYYEHIIRDDKEMNNIREYICNNPINWKIDEENPDNLQPQRGAVQEAQGKNET